MSRKEKRMQNIREAKDRKMKKVAAGLGVVLVAVLAFEVPPMLKGSGGGSSTPPAATTDASTATGSPASAGSTTTPPGTAAAAVMPVANSKLPNSDTQPKIGKSQLYSFSQFGDKDPFVQQVSTATGSLSTPSTGSSSSAAAPAVPIAPTAAVSRNVGDRTLAVTGAARIAINGRIQVVRIGASFPSANPLFKLVTNSHGVARIGIASGSYSSGAKTVSLVVGRTLTLVDTADGIRYQLRLLP